VFELAVKQFKEPSGIIVVSEAVDELRVVVQRRHEQLSL
jgi:hypothetical protein